MRSEERMHSRLRNMAIYFVQNSNSVNQLKLEKLFYFADLHSFRENIFTISNQQYVARENGPVPVIDGKDLFEAENFSDFLYKNAQNFFITNKKFDDSNFSPYEIGIMAEICCKYKTLSGEQMSRLSHEKNGPWDRVWKNGTGNGVEISFNDIERACFSLMEFTKRREQRKLYLQHEKELEDFAVFMESS